MPRPVEHRDGSLADQAIRAWLPSDAARVVVLTDSDSLPGAETAVDAVIAYVARDDDPAASLQRALTVARAGATIVFVEPAPPAKPRVIAYAIGRARRRRALRRALAGCGLSARRVILVPSLDRPFLWFDDQAPPRVIRHAMAHFGFRQRQRALKFLSVFARRPFVGWWAPALLHIVIAP